MPPIEVKSISVTRKGNPPEPTGPVLNSHGTIRSVSHDYGDKYASVEVSHGRQKKAKGGKNNVPMLFDERPTSRFSISKAHAHHFPVGKRVKISMMPMDGQAGADASEGDES